MSVLSDIWNWISDLLSGLWTWIKDVIPYLLLALALYVGFMTGPGLMFLGMLIPAGWVSASIILGVSFLFLPSETSAILSDAVSAVGDTVGSVAAELGSAIGSGVSALASSSGLSTILWVATAGGLLWLLLSDDKKNADEQTSDKGRAVGGRDLTITNKNGGNPIVTNS